MRRFLKYWMIRLLGRGFIILPLRCKLAGLWWSFSLMVICGLRGTTTAMAATGYHGELRRQHLCGHGGF